MYGKCLLLSLSIVLGNSLIAQTTNVLFIGNSYTYFNSMPQMLKEVALSAGDTLYVETYTRGGARFLTHANNPEVYDIIRNGNWDFVVLQGQSQEPSWPDKQVSTEVFPYAKQLCDSIIANNRCAKPLFFMTWGRKNGDSRNCADWPYVCTYAGMDSILNLNYLKMGSLNNAEVAPVGAVWNQLRNTTPGLELYNSDESHPSLKGSVAAAFTFYSTIARKNTDNVTFTGTLSNNEIDSIKAAVNRVAFINSKDYYIGCIKADASILSSKDGCSVVVKANKGYDDYSWNFGDGTADYLDSITHHYQTPGTYKIKLTVGNCNEIALDSTSFTCGTGGFNGLSQSPLLVYPNPSNGFFTISSNFKVLSIYNTNGQSLPFTQNDLSVIKLGKNEKGLIFIELEGKNGVKLVTKLMLE